MKKENNGKKNDKGEVISVRGVTFHLKKLIGKKYSTPTILEKALPMFLEAGVDEKVARNRIHAYLFRLRKAKEAQK